MGVISKIVQYFRGTRALGNSNRSSHPSIPTEDKDQPQGAENILFYIDCPCDCGRSIRMVLSPVKPNKQYDIPGIGNKFWRQLVDRNGLEAAVEYLHENA